MGKEYEVEPTPKEYLCEIHNVTSQAGNVDLGRGVKIKHIPLKLMKLIDKYTGRRITRLQGHKPWFLSGQYLVDNTFPNSDPGGLLQLARTVLLLFYGEKVKFGPFIMLYDTSAGKPVVATIWSRLSEVLPSGRPDEFTIKKDSIVPLKTLFEQLVQGFDAPLLKIPIDRYVRACDDKRPDDAIIDQSIALEALYLSSNDHPNKKAPIAKRGAAFLGDDSISREQIYYNLCCFYEARNEIIHEGKEYPNITLKSGFSKNSIELRDCCFQYLRTTFRKILACAKYLKIDNNAFIDELNASTKTWKTEFDTLQRNSKKC